MPRSQKACRECGHQASDGWYISKTGKCRPCSVARAVALIDAMFPPDPPEVDLPDARTPGQKWADGVARAHRNGIITAGLRQVTQG